MLDAERVKCYAYGYILTTQERLRRLPVGEGLADLEYVVIRSENGVRGSNCRDAASKYLAEYYSTTTFEFWEEANQFGFSFPEIGVYKIGYGSILCHPLSNVPSDLLDTFLLTNILAIWLELRSVVALHASAFVTDAGAVGLLANSGDGKSSVAAMMTSSGYPLLSDDILPVESRDAILVANPGYPFMRLWPEEAQYFLGHFEDLELVDPRFTKRWIPVGTGGLGTFCGSPQPLRCLYLLERHVIDEVNRDIRILPVSPRDAALELARYSYEALVVEAIGLQRRRLEMISRLASRIPVRRIIYPSGLEELARVRNAILEDLRSSNPFPLDYLLQ